MDVYKNWSGNSGVHSFEIGDSYIKVRFRESNTIYTYSHKKAGRQHVENMKNLAVSGRGLSTYISRNVSELYD